MTTYARAERKMAILMLRAAAELRNTKQSASQDERDPGVPQGEPGSDAYRDAECAVKRYGEELAAMPQLWGFMQCWMVDVVGDGPCPTFDEPTAAVAVEDNQAFVSNVGGGMAIAIRTFIAGTLRMTITDSGAGCGSWHFGVPCDERDALQLCASLHQRFAAAIEGGTIRVLRKFWGWKLPTMRNSHDAERYAAEHNLNEDSEYE